MEKQILRINDDGVTIITNKGEIVNRKERVTLEGTFEISATDVARLLALLDGLSLNTGAVLSIPASSFVINEDLLPYVRHIPQNRWCILPDEDVASLTKRLSEEHAAAIKKLQEIYESKLADIRSRVYDYNNSRRPWERRVELGSAVTPSPSKFRCL